MDLQHHYFEINCRKGCNNQVANALSRRSYPEQHNDENGVAAVMISEVNIGTEAIGKDRSSKRVRVNNGEKWIKQLCLPQALKEDALLSYHDSFITSALRFYSSGSFQLVNAEVHNIPRPRDVTSRLTSCFQKLYKMPTVETGLHNNMRGYYEKTNFPKMADTAEEAVASERSIGCIQGKTFPDGEALNTSKVVTQTKQSNTRTGPDKVNIKQLPQVKHWPKSSRYKAVATSKALAQYIVNNPLLLESTG
ncbi:unnamed protein product [Mytilus coruscus]|uniref:Uncharacterized protein n=1 Tax=Mytilus coruscus TaxID=42192 RepID=A0A6J8DRQ6_MYTCO|nr:unnamed protein product [Mytilus coruscus]